MSDRGRRKTAIGVVISDKMDNSIRVRIERLEKHPLYKKYMKKWTKLTAHDENNEAKVGDKVEVMETRPMSKTKRWRLVKILEKKAIV
ncbi:MAG: 30S ribosomal protein S17 [Planctomycetota bacterium]|nr:30S ribosomal protein S17 [Planctomycetota bacterium]